MRVLWLHNNPGRSSGTFMWDIFDRIQEEGPELRLEEMSIPLMRRAGAFREAFRIASAEKGWDIVHAQYGALVGLLATRHRQSARIVSLRGSDMYWRYGTVRDRLGGLARTFLSWLGCLRSDAIIVMSRRMEKEVRRWPGCAGKMVTYLPDPAGEMFWPSTAVKLRAQLYAAPFRVVMASLQHNNPIKRTEIVEDAARLCNAAGLSVNLRVLSGVPRVEVRDAIASADSIALASTHEGWPNILKEGLLLGKPFVATNVGDLASFAPASSANRIVEANALAFAFGWVEQIALRACRNSGFSVELLGFHPDVVAMKIKLLYIYVMGLRQ